MIASVVPPRTTPNGSSGVTIALEPAALALTGDVTRIADLADPVSGAIGDQAALHDDEPALTALVLSIASLSVGNRLNVATGQVAGAARSREAPALSEAKTAYRDGIVRNGGGGERASRPSCKPVFGLLPGIA